MRLRQDSWLIVVSREPEGRDDVLFSLETCRAAVANLRDLAMLCVAAGVSRWSLPPECKESTVSIGVEAVVSRGKPLVRIQLPVKTRTVAISGKTAIDLADKIEQAAACAERHLRWQEERDPRCLIVS